ncbi:MAG TPA: hypothetical protein VN429_08555 [Methanospirillum sp.]|nr:hypothetical protein [Methanospirillum sp.]HWQ64455.1 hypothetical protein [Methanospirillum sp.]
MAREIPTTVRGGTSDIAIVAPGSESLILFLLIANAPATPEARATKRAKISGDVWDRICGFILKSIPTGETHIDMNIARRTTYKTLKNALPRDIEALLLSPRTMARVVAIIGNIMGDRIIAPITVSVDPEMTPYVEMIVASVKRTT